MSLMAERRECPKCQRKMALLHHSDEWSFGSCCRWCDYSAIQQRDASPAMCWEGSAHEDRETADAPRHGESITAGVESPPELGTTGGS